MLRKMSDAVDNFAGKAPQFEDLTMLCVAYHGRMEERDMKELVLEARIDNLEKVLEFINEQMDACGCSMKAQTQINIAVEEIFVNIASYAYDGNPGSAKIEVLTSKEDPRFVEVTFTDSGVPYDPLAKTDPDVSLSAEERQIGGLGIFLVKKSMDDVQYEYRDGKNILKIRKNL